MLVSLNHVELLTHISGLGRVLNLEFGAWEASLPTLRRWLNGDEEVL